MGSPDNISARSAKRMTSRPRPALLRAVLSPRGLMVVVLLAGAAWRVGRYAANWPLWGDEAFVAANFIDRGYADMLHPPLEYGQILPLGFLWAELAITKALGLSEWALHLLPVVSGLAALLVTWRLCAASLDRRTALLAVAVLAASYYPVRHSVEVKPYAGDMLVAAVLLYLAWRVRHGPGRAVGWAALTAGGAVAVWLSLPAAFVVGGVGIFLGWDLLTRRRWRAVVPLGIFAAASAASFVWMYQVFAGPTAAANPWYWTIPTWQKAFPPLGQPWLIPWWLLDVHAGNMMAYPIGGKHFGSTGTLLLVIVGSVSLWRRGRRDLVILLLSPLLPAMVAAALRKYPYGSSARVMLFAAPSFCLLAGAGLMAVFRRFVPVRLRGRAVRIAVAVLTIWALGGLTSNILWPYKRESNLDARRTVQTITASFAPTDQVLVANHKKRFQFLPFWEGTDASVIQFYLRTLSRAPIRWAVPPEQVHPIAGKTWVIFYQTPMPSGGPEQRAVAEHQLRDYLRQLTDRLGAPAVKKYGMIPAYPDRPPGALWVYLFPPRSQTREAETRPSGP
jgi:hypothetical protein